MKLSDFKGLFNKSILKVKKINNPYKDYYEIYLTPGVNTSWKPGDHGIFRLPNNKVEGKKWRAFSVASIPEENIIILGTRTGNKVSSFKQELI